MQPISTSRWPCSGSRPVVSVSSTISRMASAPRSGESASAACGIVATARKNRLHLGARGIESVRRIHHEIGAPALFGVRHLLGQQWRRAFPASCPAAPARAAAAPRPAPTPPRRRRPARRRRSRTAAEYRAPRPSRRALPRVGQEAAARPRAPADARSPPAACSAGGIVEHARRELAAIDLAVLRGARKRRFDRGHRLALVEPMHHRIGIVHRHAGLGEEARGGRFSHADRAGEAEHEHDRKVLKRRLFASRRQRQPSRRRNCSSGSSGRPRIVKWSPSMRSNRWMPRPSS